MMLFPNSCGEPNFFPLGKKYIRNGTTSLLMQHRSRPIPIIGTCPRQIITKYFIKYG